MAAPDTLRGPPARLGSAATLAWAALPGAGPDRLRARSVPPVGQGVWLSFFHWNGVTAATWAGLSNYTTFFTDPTLRAAVEHALLFVVFFSLLPIVLGLLTAR